MSDLLAELQCAAVEDDPVDAGAAAVGTCDGHGDNQTQDNLHIPGHSPDGNHFGAGTVDDAPTAAAVGTCVVGASFAVGGAADTGGDDVVDVEDIEAAEVADHVELDCPPGQRLAD